MSTKAIREALRMAVERRGFGDTEEEMKAVDDAEAELEAIEKAAKDITRLSASDFIYNVRNREVTQRWSIDSGKDAWEAPDVKSWGDACMLLKSIANGAK